MCAKHNIIPFNHFGGVKGKSAEDAALAFTHDLQAAHNHGFVASSLTYDIQGFFDNVSHPVLLSTMRKKHLPIAAILWTKAFLSHRRTIICLDGRRDKIRDIETGIPQGSPVSPILAALLTSTLSDSIIRGFNDDDTPLYLKHCMAKDQAKECGSWLYVDDGRLLAISRSLNTCALEHAAKHTIIWMDARGMRMDRVKMDLTHYTWRKRVQEHPSVTIRYPGGETHRIDPTPTTKWIGIHFDNKLTFVEHTKEAAAKAMRVANASALLGNSIHGLSPYLRRQLYLGVVLPMMTYGSPVWWKGTKRQATILETVQNKALRQITGAFSTTADQGNGNRSIHPSHHSLPRLGQQTRRNSLPAPTPVPPDLRSPPATPPRHEPT
jgi:hypothetical protein